MLMYTLYLHLQGLPVSNVNISTPHWKFNFLQKYYHVVGIAILPDIPAPV